MNINHINMNEPNKRMINRKSLPNCKCIDDWWHEINKIWNYLAYHYESN